MRIKKSIIVCALSGIILTPSIMSVSAQSSVHQLKQYLLMENNQVLDINDYNTNNDGDVNIFDFCRLKRDILNKPEITTAPVTTEYIKTGYVSFEFNNPEISSDGKKIKIPIMVKNNTIGIISVQMNINYDDRYYKISSVENGNMGGRWTCSGSSSLVQFDSGNGSEITSDGVIGYIVFDVAQYTPSSTYIFSASGLQAVTLLNNNNSRPVTVSECPDTIYDRYIWYNNTQQVISTTPSLVTTVTTTMPVTTEITTTTPPVTTTLPVTTTPPVTTTLPVTTTPPVTTTLPVITTPPVTTTPLVTTTSQPQIIAEKSDMELELVSLINQWRKDINLSPLNEYDVLFYCADIRAKELQQSFSLNRPDGSSVMGLLRTSGANGWYDFSQYLDKGANVTRVLTQYKSAARSSPGVSVDNPSYTRIGVGYYNGYWDILLT